MLRSLFGLGRSDNRRTVDRLYAAIVAAARQPHFYSAWSVPDTPLGRFEMLSLHLFLVAHAARGETRLADLMQDLTDEFFRDVDHSLRELGIGDLGIPKRMKKLARMHYGRAAAYGEAIDAGDRGGLAAALARNVRPGDAAAWPGADGIAAYAIEANGLLAGQAPEEWLDGEVSFPDAGRPAP